VLFLAACLRVGRGGVGESFSTALDSADREALIEASLFMGPGWMGVWEGAWGEVPRMLEMVGCAMNAVRMGFKLA
jgi:hypothetical protein